MRGRLQISLQGVGFGIAAIGVACAALVSTSRIWVGVLFATVVVVLLLSVLAALYREHEVRAFWLGFALFGVTYFALAIGPGSQVTEPNMPTAPLLDWGYQLIPTREVRASTILLPKGTPGIRRDSPTGGYLGTFVVLPLERDFRLVGHLLWTLVFSIFGGAMARLIATKPLRCN